MNVFGLLSYINKVSLLAFFITTLVVGYQVYVLKKEKTKKQTPSIPDFKEKSFFNETANFTSLPSFLTKKKVKTVNYSKLIFLIISLLTIVIVIFVISLINKNNITHNQVLITPPAVISQTPTHKLISPTPKIILSPTLIAALSPKLSLPTVTPSPLPTLIRTLLTSTVSPTATLLQTSTPAVSPTIVPTEIILAQAPSLTPAANSTEGTVNKPQVLPETGSWEKGLLIIGVAISTIFFSFWF